MRRYLNCESWTWEKLEKLNIFPWCLQFVSLASLKADTLVEYVELSSRTLWHETIPVPFQSTTNWCPHQCHQKFRNWGPLSQSPTWHENNALSHLAPAVNEYWPTWIWQKTCATSPGTKMITDRSTHSSSSHSHQMSLFRWIRLNFEVRDWKCRQSIEWLQDASFQSDYCFKLPPSECQCSACCGVEIDSLKQSPLPKRL